MKIRRGVYRTIIRLEADDLIELLTRGFVASKDSRIKIPLDEGAKKALIDREAAILDQGSASNEAAQALIGKIHHALRIAEETASDYDRLAKELKETDPATYLEFAYLAAGIREATVNLRTILLEQPDGKQD